MRNPLPVRLAQIGLLSTLSLVIVFHLLVIIGIIPFEIVWGGRLKTRSQMLSFETVSILINVLMVMVVSFHSKLLKVNLHRWLLKGALWIMFVLFLANTLGNLFSINLFEKIAFTPLTFLLAVFSLRLALHRDERLTI
jgi:hypothetical protein